jgi:soluble lytic murein transglycosylase-like protein
MIRLNPKFWIFPSIVLSAVLLLITSNSIADHNVLQINNWNKSQFDTSPINHAYGNLSEKYPQSIQIWRKEIENSAVLNNLDPNLIAAVMLQESGGQPSVISSSGAVGLMQIMPKDGLASKFICSDTPCFENRPTIQELLNPIFNINYGAHMLSGLHTTLGSMRAALKSYGPMDVGFYYADIVLSIYSQNI